jgi:dienelactone hydrolase
MTDTQNATTSTDASSEPSPAITDSARGAATRHPGLVVLHDWYGLDETTRESVERLGRLGYAVHAPDLFAPGGPPADATSDSALADWALTQYDTAIVSRVLAAIDELAAREDVNPAQIGLIGFGWGGTYALIAAAHDGRVKAAASIGGAISYPVLTQRRPGSPLNFVASLEGALFAGFAGDDELSPEIEVERLRARLIEHDKIGEVKIYGGARPRFWRDASLPQTAALWRRLEHFLTAQLQPQTLAEARFADIVAHEEGYPNANAVETGYPNEASRLHA